MIDEYFEENFASYFEKRKSSAAAFKLHYHIVISTKYRKPVLQEEIASKCKDFIVETCIENGYQLFGLSIIKDHVHIIVGLKPTDKLSEVLQRLKGKSSFSVSKAFPHLRGIIGSNSLWADGYSVDSLGKANIAQVKAYLDKQPEHHTVAPPDKSGGSGKS